jgi:hypothetical protein
MTADDTAGRITLGTDELTLLVTTDPLLVIQVDMPAGGGPPLVP